MNENGLTMTEFPISAERLAGLIAMIDAGQVSHSVASQKLFPLLLTNSEQSALELAKSNDLLQEDRSDLVENIMKEVMAQYPDKVEAYRAGNKGLLGLFMGEVMKGTKGKADPKRANEVVRKLLEQPKA
jgi:aspartyl-tRNA(Asn)/glutamyl-tRNA(Gln) amidotransferase subunit B